MLIQLAIGGKNSIYNQAPGNNKAEEVVEIVLYRIRRM